MSIVIDFKSKFPEFDATKVDAFFASSGELYKCFYNGNYNNDCDKQKILYLNAHLLKLEETKTPQFPTASKSVGDVSVSYSITSQPKSEFWNSSYYGQIYYQLFENSSIGIRCV